MLLLGPCLLYLIAFSIYPLIYSLKLSLTDLRAADETLDDWHDRGWRGTGRADSPDDDRDRGQG